MSAVPDEHPVQALSSGGPHEPLGVCIRHWAGRSGSRRPNAVRWWRRLDFVADECELLRRAGFAIRVAVGVPVLC
jgi:hypothetical protein